MWDDYAKTIGKTSNNLTQQEKITAEVNGILEETKFQIGDAAKYADTFAGRTARLSQTFYTLKTTIGDVIMPIADLFIPIIQKAMDKLVSFFTILKQVMGAFGLKSSSSVNNTSSSFENLGTNATKTADEVSKASKKINKATMNYDELNVLQKNDKSSSNDNTSSSGAVSVGDIMDSTVEDKISPKVQKIVDKTKMMWSGFKSFLSDVWDSDVVKSFGGAVSSMIGLYILYWSSLFTNLKNNISLTWTNISDNFSLSVSNMSFLWVSFYDTLQNTIDIYGPQLINNMFSLFNSIWTGAIDPFIQIVVKAWTDFTSDLVTLWNQYGQPLADNIGTFVVGLADTFNKLWTNIFYPIIQPFLEMLSNLWNNHLRGMVKECTEFVLNVVNSFLTLYNKWGKPIIDFLIEVLGPIFSSTFKTVWSVVGTAIGFISDGIKNLMSILNGIINFVTGVFTGDWKKAWSGVKDIFGGIWNQMSNLIKTPLNLILGVVEGFINKIIGGFNAFKKAINKLSINIPDWLGGGKLGFNLAMSNDVSLPRLAEGGWVEPNKPRPVIVGDNKREGEIIAPESKIYDQGYKAASDALKNSQQYAKLEITLIHKYPDGRYMIQEINETQIKDGKITLLT